MSNDLLKNPRPSATTAPPASSNPTAAASPVANDPRTRAARRAAELRDHAGGSMDSGTDKFYIDPQKIPDGWTYEWKTHTVLNKANPAYQVSLARRGWEAVPLSRHPEEMPEGYASETIERDGMILMELPTEVYNELKLKEKRKARLQVSDKEQQLNGAPAGQFERDADPRTRANIKKTYEHIPIPDK